MLLRNCLGRFEGDACRKGTIFVHIIKHALGCVCYLISSPVLVCYLISLGCVCYLISSPVLVCYLISLGGVCYLISSPVLVCIELTICRRTGAPKGMVCTLNTFQNFPGDEGLGRNVCRRLRLTKFYVNFQVPSYVVYVKRPHKFLRT